MGERFPRGVRGGWTRKGVSPREALHEKKERIRTGEVGARERTRQTQEKQRTAQREQRIADRREKIAALHLQKGSLVEYQGTRYAYTGIVTEDGRIRCRKVLQRSSVTVYKDLDPRAVTVVPTASEG